MSFIIAAALTLLTTPGLNLRFLSITRNQVIAGPFRHGGYPGHVWYCAPQGDDSYREQREEAMLNTAREQASLSCLPQNAPSPE